MTEAREGDCNVDTDARISRRSKEVVRRETDVVKGGTERRILRIRTGLRKGRMRE